LAVKLENVGQAFAIEFDLNVQDSLQGFAIQFPRVGQSSGVDFRVQLYKNSLDSPPIYISTIYNSYFPDEFNLGLANFITYKLRLDDGEVKGILLEPGKYFLSVTQQQSLGRLQIGLDRNNDQFTEKNFFFNANDWVSLGIDGALALRAIMGNKKPIATAINDDATKKLPFEIYPNPTQDFIHWKNAPQQKLVRVYDLYGRLLIEQEDPNQLNVQQLPSGSYYLQMLDLKNGNSGIRIFEILR